VPVWGLTNAGPRNHVLDEVQIPTGRGYCKEWQNGNEAFYQITLDSCDKCISYWVRRSIVSGLNDTDGSKTNGTNEQCHHANNIPLITSAWPFDTTRLYAHIQIFVIYRPLHRSLLKCIHI